MYTTTVEAIKDFQLCALLHEFRHQKKMPESMWERELLSVRYSQTMKKVVSFFFYKRQAGITPSYNALLNRWERLWFPKDTTAYDIASIQHGVSHGNESTMNTLATSALLQFHEEFSELNADPLIIDDKYFVPIGKTIRLEGSIDLVLRMKDKSYRTILWSTSARHKSAGTMLLEFAAVRHAFEHKFGGRHVSYYQYDVGSSRPGKTEVFPSDNDLNALKFWATELSNTEHFVPRRGLTSYCKTCPFDKPCSKWKEWPDGKVDG